MRIDSYVSERRRKQKKRRKYFWSIVVFLAVYLIFLGIVAFIVRLPAFQVQQITIQGESAVPQADIMNLLQASIIREGDAPSAPNNGLKAMLGFHNMLIWPDALPSSTVAAIPQLAGVTISKNYFLHTITVTVTEREPFAVWCVMSDDDCYWFDNTGDAFESTLDTQGGAITVVHDYSSSTVSAAPLALGGKVLPDEFMPNLISILDVLQESGVGVSDIALNDLSLEQIDVTTVNGPTLYFSLHFPADEDLAVLENLMAQPGFDKLQYVDFTVQNRAYYK